jgi:hypothetical protein
MKSERTRPQPQAKTSKMSPIHPQKIAPALLFSSTINLGRAYLFNLSLTITQQSTTSWTGSLLSPLPLSFDLT